MIWIKFSMLLRHAGVLTMEIVLFYTINIWGMGHHFGDYKIAFNVGCFRTIFHRFSSSSFFSFLSFQTGCGDRHNSTLPFGTSFSDLEFSPRSSGYEKTNSSIIHLLFLNRSQEKTACC